MRLNYYYNFKNTIRFFMNIENIDFSMIDLGVHCWTEPFNFRIRKTENSFRTLQIPNIYNFKIAYEYYKNKITEFTYNFDHFELLDSHKRMEISYELGEFKENSYDAWKLDDFQKLIDYDYLLRYDIKSFYENIYTHYIFNDKTIDKYVDKPLSHLYNGRTAGIVMGNYISLFSAEVLLKRISENFQSKIESENINCYFSYFSDDFYIFVNKNDVEKITSLFDETLEKFNLVRNIYKIVKYNYLEYSNNDKIEKYWKTITRECKNQQNYQNYLKLTGELKFDNNLFFTNQLIYRLNKLDDYREKRVFIINFFKSKFYRNIDFSKTIICGYNYHQILFLIKQFPEICLYIDNLIDNIEEFKSEDFKEKIKSFYLNSLKKNYHEEQLYYLYLIYKLNYLDNVKSLDINSMVLDSRNYILISYYIKYNLFSEENLEMLKNMEIEECYWLVYYYLIIYDADLYSNLEDSVKKYLIPNNANSDNNKNAYKNFYIKNIKDRNEILYNFDEVNKNLENYFLVKNHETSTEDNNEEWNNHEDFDDVEEFDLKYVNE